MPITTDMGLGLERRTAPRARVEITSLLRAQDRKICAIIIDLSKGGMAVRAAETLPSDSLVDVWFSLPYSEQTVQCEGKVVWNDGLGHAGVQFRDLKDETQQSITEWLTRYAPKTSSRS